MEKIRKEQAEAKRKAREEALEAEKMFEKENEDRMRRAAEKQKEREEARKKAEEEATRFEKLLKEQEQEQARRLEEKRKQREEDNNRKNDRRAVLYNIKLPNKSYYYS